MQISVQFGKKKKTDKGRPKKKASRNKKVILQRVDSFSKELIYINLILLLVAFGWSMYLCTKNLLDPQCIFTEVCDCWKRTFPIYLCKSGIENISKAITNTLSGKGGSVNGYSSEWDSNGVSDNGFSRASEDNRDV